MISDYRLEEIQARPLYKLSGYVFKSGNTDYNNESAANFQLTESDFSAGGNTIRVDGGGAYPIGNAICKTCTLALKPSENYTANDFNGACIRLIIKAYNQAGSWVVTRDHYFVQTVAAKGGQIVLECADFMSKANVPYKRAGYLASTATLANLFADICRQCGVAASGGSTFRNSDFTYTIYAWAKFNSYTCRQMLSFISMIAGGNAIATAGATAFEIHTLDNTGGNSLYQWSEFTDEAESIAVTGVEMTEKTDLARKPDESPSTYKSSVYSAGYVLDLTDTANPLFKGRDQQAVNLIMSAVSGLTMRNFSGTHIGYPLAEYGDYAAITHRDGSLSSFITDYEWNISGATTFACDVNGAVANSETYDGGVAIGDTSDYITEQGTSGGWNYRKWNSGYAECWRTVTISGMACNTAVGSWYRTSEIKNTAYPFTFSETPNVNMFFETASGTSGLVWSAGTSTDVSNDRAQAHQFYIIRMLSSNSISGRVHIQVKGKWKDDSGLVGGGTELFRASGSEEFYCQR